MKDRFDEGIRILLRSLEAAEGFKGRALLGLQLRDERIEIDAHGASRSWTKCFAATGLEIRHPGAQALYMFLFFEGWPAVVAHFFAKVLD